MTETQPDDSTSDRRRGATAGRHTVAKVIISSLVVVAMVTGLGVVFLYRHLNDNLDVLDPGSMLTDRPQKAVADAPQEPLNILVMGSDTREGEGNAIDQESGAGGSDTTLLVHLSADREDAYGISIPRDSIIDRPVCTTAGGERLPAATDVMWNEAFTVGGPVCTVQQFEQLSGVFVDHFVVVDFNGFRDMVDAIGGVEVCIPEDIDDPEHGINIPAGTREISGYEALNYVRARYTLGDGSDIGRIKRQQAFIAAMASKVVSGGMLARPDQLVGFLDAATESLTVDPGLSDVLKIGRIGLSFGGIGLDNIRFSTVPFEYDTRPEFEGRVVWTPEAADVWDKIAADEPLTPRLEEDAVISADSVPGTSGDESASPSEAPSSGPSRGPSPQADPEREAQLEAAGLCA